jgi:hypothetical protein
LKAAGSPITSPYHPADEVSMADFSKVVAIPIPSTSHAT